MHINCPHCQNGIEIVPERPIETLTCPTCGSSFNLLDVNTATYRETVPKNVGRFELVERLGSGHFGDVWMAKDPQLDRFVAIKLPRKEVLERADIELLLREARSAAQLKHANIVSVHEVGKDGDRVYIVSDLVRGPNLADWLSENKFSPSQAAELCATLADAIHHAHENGVIHRDLKPGNVLLDGYKVPHVTDFGLAKRDGGEVTVTVEGKIIGTPAYMSPEQARGDAHNADRRSDVYSLGVILYELLTGVRPFAGKSKLMMIHQVLHEDPRPLRKIRKSVPRDLETICLKAMSKEPTRRYQTAGELAEDLRRHLAGRPILARSVSHSERTWRWVRRNRALAASGAIAFVSVVCACAAALVPHSDGIPRRTVQIGANEPDATIAFIPLHAKSGQPQPDKAVTSTMAGQSPVKVRLISGDYLVVAFRGEPESASEFHEVQRHVPDLDEPANKKGYRHEQWTTDPGGTLTLADVRLFSTSEVAANMATIPKYANVVIGTELLPNDAPPHRRQVPAFFLDLTEVTVGDARGLENWYLPEKLRNNPPADSHPLTFVRHEYAVAYAERVGKRLMDEAEYEVAATRGGTLKVPWGGDVSDIEKWEIGPVTSPVLDTIHYDRDVVGLYSNAVEWTSTWGIVYPKFASASLPFAPHDFRVLRGGLLAGVANPQFAPGAGADKPDPRPFWDKGPRMRELVPAVAMFPELGFRCARSLKPRLREYDFVTVNRE